MTQANPSQDFDRWAPTYDADVAEDGLFPFDGYQRILERLVTLAEITLGRAVLELGVGTGNLTALLAQQGAALWGLDFSPAMLVQARQRVPAATLAKADLLGAYPEVVNRRFPVIVSSYVFHEFPRDQKRDLLRRLVADYLEPNGRILIGDIGFPSAAERERVRQLAGNRWDEEYYWLMADERPWLAELGLDVLYEQHSSCGVVLALTPRRP